MRRVILHHTYNRGVAIDRSKFGNHGHVFGTPPSMAPGTLRMYPPDARVVVPPSESLRRIESIEIEVRFRIDSHSWAPRHNLIEGELSYAFMVEGYGQLTGTLYQAPGWPGTKSAEHVVAPGVWHTGTYAYSSTSGTLTLALDGVEVARRTGLAGPPRPLGPRGITIGRWPPAAQYQMHGDLDEVKITATWPETEDVLSGCCDDPEALDRLTDRVRRDPAVATGDVDPTAALSDLLSVSGRVRELIANGDDDRREAAEQLSREFDRAHARGDMPAMLRTVGKGFAAIATSGNAMADFAAAGQDGLAVLRRLEVGRVMVDELIAAARSLRGSRALHLQRGALEVTGKLRAFADDAARVMCLDRPTPGTRRPPRDGGDPPPRDGDDGPVVPDFPDRPKDYDHHEKRHDRHEDKPREHDEAGKGDPCVDEEARASNRHRPRLTPFGGVPTVTAQPRPARRSQGDS